MRKDIDFEYLSKIRNAFSLKTGRKSTNILEGDFRSVYRGRSMEFDELGAYMTGDDVHDIDWKSSSRSGQILVRRYVAERKHFLLFVADCGRKMCADTPAGEHKEDIACMTFATAAFLCDRAGADYTLLYGDEDTIGHELFRSGMNHLEKLMQICADHIGKETKNDVTALLEYASEHIRKKTILFLITDIDGLAKIDERLVERVTERHDLLVVNIDDAYISDARAFDISSARYADTFLVPSKKLAREEKMLRERILTQKEALFRKTRTGYISIAKEEDIVDRVIHLFRDR